MRASSPAGYEAFAVRRESDHGDLALRRMVSEAVDREQHQLAQLLHDSVCQSLTGVQMLARVLAHKLQTIAPEAADGVAELDHLLHQAASELHELVNGLRRAEVARDGLISALRALAREISEQIPCEVEHPPALAFADAYTPSQLYQIAEVAIAYAVRRARVSRIVVSLIIKHAELTLSIRDDAPRSELPGQGSVERLFSWQVLERRARAIGATLEMHSSSSGTCATCRLAHPG